MSVRALRDWVAVNRPDLLDELTNRPPEHGVSILNGLTGLNERYSASQGEAICARFLQKLKGQAMAISHDDDYAKKRHMEDELRSAQAMYEMQRYQSAAQGLGQAVAQRAQPTPITQPEPNKVLLLLGEDE
jgi:hypothetical protein